MSKITLRNILLLFIISICLSCQSENASNTFITCSTDCDSLQEEMEGNQLRAIYTYNNGRREGDFVLFENGDTVFGTHEYVGSYLKRTIKGPNNNYVVDLYILEDDNYKPSEFISYNQFKEIMPGESHYIDIKRGEKVVISPKLQGAYDSIHLYSGNDLLSKTSMSDGAITVEADSLEANNDISLLVFYDLGKNKDGRREIEGFTFPLTQERLQDEFLSPHLIDD